MSKKQEADLIIVSDEKFEELKREFFIDDAELEFYAQSLEHEDIDPATALIDVPTVVVE